MVCDFFFLIFSENELTEYDINTDIMNTLWGIQIDTIR